MTRERPACVTIFGALTLVVAIYLLTFHISRGSYIIVMVVDCLWIVLAVGILRMKRWARWVALFVCSVIALAVLVMVIAAVAGMKTSPDLLKGRELNFLLSCGSSLVYALWGLLLLTRTEVKDLFDRYADSLTEEE